MIFKGQRQIVHLTKQSHTEGALREEEQVVKAQVEKVESCDPQVPSYLSL